jgi:hypothetical protein
MIGASPPITLVNEDAARFSSFDVGADFVAYLWDRGFGLQSFRTIVAACLQSPHCRGIISDRDALEVASAQVSYVLVQYIALAT